MNKTLIAKTETGDALYQLGVSINPETVGLPADAFRRVMMPPGETPKWAYGYVEYARGDSYEVNDLNVFLMHNPWFEQVADINDTVDG